MYEEEIYEFEELEESISFDDLRFYRHLASAKLRETKAAQAATGGQGWSGWISSMVTSSSPTKAADPAQELKKLYEAIDIGASDFTLSATNEDVFEG